MAFNSVNNGAVVLSFNEAAKHCCLRGMSLIGYMKREHPVDYYNRELFQRSMDAIKTAMDTNLSPRAREYLICGAYWLLHLSLSSHLTTQLSVKEEANTCDFSETFYDDWKELLSDVERLKPCEFPSCETKSNKKVVKNTQERRVKSRR